MTDVLGVGEGRVIGVDVSQLLYILRSSAVSSKTAPAFSTVFPLQRKLLINHVTFLRD